MMGDVDEDDDESQEGGVGNEAYNEMGNDTTNDENGGEVNEGENDDSDAYDNEGK